jgi:ubiquinone/menaquinone biosynthesis C-methylase UbiE
MFNKSKAKQFNKKAASEKFKPKEIIASLNTKPGDIIADVGSGGGYYAFEFAKKTGPSGKVYALDTNQELLNYINSEIQTQGITNVQTVLTKNDDLGLAENSIDLMFLRNVYHHLPEPIKYFGRIKKYLKLHGRIAIIEYNKKRFHLFLRGRHFTPESEIVGTMTRCGYIISNRFDFLPEQSFVIFKKE